MSIKPLVNLFSAASIAAAASIVSLPGAQAMTIAPLAVTQDHAVLAMPGSVVGAAGAAIDGVVGKIDRSARPRLYEAR